MYRHVTPHEESKHKDPEMEEGDRGGGWGDNGRYGVGVRDNGFIRREEVYEMEDIKD